VLTACLLWKSEVQSQICGLMKFAILGLLENFMDSPRILTLKHLDGCIVVRRGPVDRLYSVAPVHSELTNAFSCREKAIFSGKLY
jgi:hypothetical protein